MLRNNTEIQIFVWTWTVNVEIIMYHRLQNLFLSDENILIHFLFLAQQYIIISSRGGHGGSNHTSNQ